jgi:hypothetical protein
VDKAERANLLRERFKAKCNRPYVPSGIQPKPIEPERSKVTFQSWPRCEGMNTEGLESWVRKPDPARAVKLQTTRAARASPLTKIAEKWRRFTPR